MNKFGRLFFYGIIIATIAAGGFVVYRAKHPAQHTFVQKQIDTQGQISFGNPHAKLHFVVFADLKCVNCKRFDMELFPDIKEHYIDTNKANYTIIPLAFMYNSIPAANAAFCIEHQNPQAAINFINYTFHHQPDESLDWATEDTLLDFAKNVPDINQSQLKQCMQNTTYYPKIRKNLVLAKQVMGQVATPALYINGVRVERFTMQSINDLVEQVSS
jgi:protein-disulfide isomerase